MIRTARHFNKLRAGIDSDPRRRERVEAMKRAYRAGEALSELRLNLDASQTEVAGVLGVTQANVSRIEHAEDVYLSTLSSYVAALGGRLRIQAVFGDRAIDVFRAPTDGSSHRSALRKVPTPKPKTAAGRKRSH